MYGERSSERANVRVVLYIRQTLPNHRRRTTGSGCLRMSSNWPGSLLLSHYCLGQLMREGGRTTSEALFGNVCSVSCVN